VVLATAGGGTSAAPAPSAAETERGRSLEFGKSVEGRPLEAIRIGERGAKRHAIVVGEIHGDEPEGREIVKRLRQRYEDMGGVRVWLVPSINPDGHADRMRKNARGVDLNRNFSVDWNGAEPPSSGYYAGPKPFSEPEARAFARLARRVRPDVTIHYHQPWGAVLTPCSGKAPIQRRYARIARMPTSCRGADLPGTVISWQNKKLPGTAFVVELAGGELSSKDRRRHARAAAAVLRG
jgi:protein MpaA